MKSQPNGKKAGESPAFLCRLIAPAGAALAFENVPRTQRNYSGVICCAVVYRGLQARLFGPGGGYVQVREVELLLCQVKIELHHSMAHLDELSDDQEKRCLYCESYQPPKANEDPRPDGTGPTPNLGELERARQHPAYSSQHGLSQCSVAGVYVRQVFHEDHYELRHSRNPTV